MRCLWLMLALALGACGADEAPDGSVDSGARMDAEADMDATADVAMQ